MKSGSDTSTSSPQSHAQIALGHMPSRSAVAACCINSAGLLRLADQDGHTLEKMASFRKFNDGQAKLLEKAADIADNTLAALKVAREYIVRIDGTMAFTNPENRATKPDLDLVDAAIAKAEGRAP